MENIGIFLSTIQFVSVMTLQIFLPCYYGNAVTANSNALTNDIFNSDWTGFDMRSRKFMIFYMELLKRPATLKAGGFFQVGLPIFAKVSRFLESYLKFCSLHLNPKNRESRNMRVV